ncbi:hypothetical protein [Peromfec virus RodF8_58]|uniref:Uncharacterized protein n=1 Tax=Peromfec virus RodF8_58 TaxID=2929385 RepID=A0A976N2Z1_9VIRU|nr:hypothetical protein [Peromfec virus RodF8_58]
MGRFKTLYDRPHQNKYETPEGDSMAEPDQSLTVRQILERFTAGTLSEDEVSLGSPYYNDDIDNPNPVILDITDIEDMARSKKKILDEIERTQKMESESNSIDVG